MTHRLITSRITGFCIVALLFAVLAVPATAQTAGKTWEIGFNAGSGDLGGDDELDLERRFDGRVGYFLNDHVQLELQLLRADAILDAELLVGLGNVVVNFRPESRVVPYVLAGGGIARIEDFQIFGDEPDEEDDGTVFQVGVGTRIFLGDSDVIALRLEVSNLWTDTDVFGSTQDTSLTAGMSWSFGR
ncbi:MAG: porin family protein [Thermoanaerobaculia bacterium]|nr:porin family protein [Thermoanaerobaculia bacterium]